MVRVAFEVSLRVSFVSMVLGSALARVATAALFALSFRCGMASVQVEALAAVVFKILKGRDDLNEAKVKDIINGLLKNPTPLIKKTNRIRKMPQGSLTNIFNIEHHIAAATSFFEKFHTFEDDTRAVILVR